MRDNFSANVKRTLANRVGHICSSPDCLRPTSGPSSNEEKAINLGKAAHITAAASEGPRYDASLTAEARSSISNGICLCSRCADLIDKDADRYPVDLLNKWKSDAEARAFKAIATSEDAVPTAATERNTAITLYVSGANARININSTDNSTNTATTRLELSDADKAFLRSLALPAEDGVEAVTVRMREAGQRDIQAFRSSREWPSNVISLNLALLGDNEQTRITLDGVAKAAGTAEGVCFISPPGTGKTTTLVQLADKIIHDGQIAAFVPLGEWSDRQESFFEFLVHRSAFSTFTPQHFMQIAYHGRLTLVLDGWNELNPDARKRALNDLKMLRREFTQLGIVIGTRRQAIPISGVVIEIEPLSDEQQLELAHKIRGEEGEALIDQARRTSGVRELISIPLYLTTLLASTPGNTFPKTKEEVLSTFVTQHENTAEKAEILQKEMHGFHKHILIGLAIAMNQAAATSLSDEKARPAISDAVAALQASKQLTAPLQPTSILDALVNAHALVRTPGSVSFQHQQFQEWYASFEVERLMAEAAQGNADSRKVLNTDVLNWSAWEESVLFACERLSRENAAGAEAVAAAIIATLGIDPMLAAEMIYRSAPEAWAHISDKVISFAKRWHIPGKIDRAVRFMITSGRPEFAEQIWPLISHADNQIHLRALRTARRFRPSVLGPDAAKQLAALPEEIRRHVVAEIGSHSGFDGMELATSIAKSDQSPAVVVEIIQSLQFRHAERHVADILQTASDDVWKRIARKGYPEKLLDAVHDARLTKMRRELIASETDAIRIISHLTEGRLAEMNAAERITQLIQSPDFPIKNDHARVAVENAFKVYPEAVAAGMLQRVAAGLELPFRTYELLENTAPVDDGPIAAAAFNMATSDRRENAAYSVVGPVTVGKMLDALFALDDEFNASDRQLAEPARKEYQRLKDAITCSRETSFLTALLERANTDNPHHIELMADLLALHGKDHDKGKLQLSADIEKQLITALEHWVNIMLTSPEATRHQASDVARAIERQAYPQFVPHLQKLLEYDFAQRDAELEEVKQTGRRSNSGVSMCYTLQYRRAFAAIGDANVVALMIEYLPDMRGFDGSFGFDAACVLMEIWNRDHPSGKDKRFSGWPNFSDVKERRARLEDTREEPPTCDFAETIFEVVRKLGKPDNASALQQHALKLAKIGLSMPYGIKRSEINALLALPQSYAVKQDLFSVAAMAGEVLSADMLLAGFHELLERAKKETWRVGGQQCEVMWWVELFPFSDRPTAVLDILDLLPQDYRYPHDFRRLLTALGHSPNAEALQVLAALAQRIPEMLQDHDWLDAMMRLETEDSARAMLDLICEGKVKGERGGMGISRLSEQLANLVRKFPALRGEIFQRYEKIAGGTPKAILEASLIEVADIPTILAIIRSHAAKKQPYDGRLAQAIEKLAIGQRPVTDWPGAFERFSVPLVEFRKELFAMLSGDVAQAVLAEACLNKIEKLRDEHGRISGEPRHPDIASGRNWPLKGYP